MDILRAFARAWPRTGNFGDQETKRTAIGEARREEEAQVKTKKMPKKRRRLRLRESRGTKGQGGRHGPTTKKQLTATLLDRCSKDGKVEEHPLEPVRPLGACSEPRPGEARRRRAFATPALARPPHSSRFQRGPKYAALGEIKMARKNRRICSRFCAKI